MPIANVLELSIAHSMAPELSARRRNDILRLKNPAKRAGALALHEFATRYPNVAGKLIGRDPEAKGLSYVGAGTDSVVYRKDDEVIKVIQGSIHAPEDLRQKMAAEKRYEHDILRNYLGSFVISQDIVVAPHPIVENCRAVQIVQPFCSIDDIAVFPEYDDPSVNMFNLADACAAYSGLDEALCDFATASRRMFESTGLIPDTSGISNVVVSLNTQPSLVIIDGQPINAGLPHLQENIAAQLDSLQAALRHVA